MKKLLAFGLIIVMLLSIVPLGSMVTLAYSATRESLQWDGSDYCYYVNGEKSNDTLIYTEYHEDYDLLYYIKDGVWQRNFDGVVEIDGMLYLIRVGRLSTAVTRYKYQDQYLYFKDGIWNTEFTGLSQYDSTWYYYQNGVWQEDANDLIKFKNVWFYIEDGKWKNTTKFFKKNGKWFYIENGKWKNRNDLIKYNGDIFCIQGGKWANKTFVFTDGYTDYYIKNGKWSKKVNGVIKLRKDLYYVKNGKIGGDFLRKYNGEYLFFMDGKYNKKVNGVYSARIPKALGGDNYSYQPVLIKDGKLLRKNTLAKYGYDWRYFQKGS